MSANVTITAFFGMADDDFKDDVYDRYIRDLHRPRKTIYVPKPPSKVTKHLNVRRINTEY
ncbi:unnamed protein product [Paramecium octaurelia]|uniref:Uncharacterized protein n=1 Tax=Paramecium octaurelia TaxID=43137 RepID=A0A8S1UDF0_PAROT|nr:unnamed protein product [Paramecium octaurelia]